MIEEILQALRIADLTYIPVTFAERHSCVEAAHNELSALRVECELHRVAHRDALEALPAALEAVRDEYISVIEICDACIKESLDTEKLETSHGLKPPQRAEHRHAYEKIKIIFSARLAALPAAGKGAE